ncbi:MAG: sulfatase-like hydrolase/transferase [Pseudomonadota bacterium]
MRPAWRFWSFAIVWLATACATAIADGEVTRPNILVVVADDLGYSDIQPFGGEIRTPTLTRLADKGLRLGNFHTHTMCTPTRAMLLTGVNNHAVGIGTMAGEARGAQTGAPGYEAYLRPGVPTIAELLQDAGYQTWVSGKWDLGGRKDPALLPDQRGFAKSFVLVEGSADFFREYQALAEIDSINYRLNGRSVSPPEPFYITNVYTDYALSFLEELDDDRPFFGYLTYTAPHYPLQAPAEFIDAYEGVFDAGYEAIRLARTERMRELGIIDVDEPAVPSALWPRWEELSGRQKAFESRRMEVYAAMVEAMDAQFARIVEALDATGRLDNTLILFLSDNGPEGGNPLDWADYYTDWAVENYDLSLANLGHSYSFAWTGPRWAEVSATPFRLYKGFASEGGTRVPAIIHWPDGARRSGVSSTYLHVLDVPATLLSLADAKHPGSERRGFLNRRLEGRDLSAFLADPKAEPGPTAHVWEMLDRRAVRSGPWKLTYANRPWGKGDEWSLFNVEHDPVEQNDLLREHPEVVARLLTIWEEYVRNNNLVLLKDGVDIRWTNRFTHFDWSPVPPAVPLERLRNRDELQGMMVQQ